MFLSELRRIGDEFVGENDYTIAEEHYKLALALYEAFFLEHHDEALASIRRLCDLLHTQQRHAELCRMLEWAFVIIQRLKASVLGESVGDAMEVVNWQHLLVPSDERLVVGGDARSLIGHRGANIQVLLVEDNPSEAEFLQESLAEAEYTFSIEWARRLTDAISKAGAGNVDVVLLDLSLPDSTNLDTFYRLSNSLPTIPVIVLTGTDDRTMAIRAIKKGAHDFLVKGKDDMRVIARSIVEAVERKKHRDVERVSMVAATRSVEHSILNAPSPFMFIDARGIVQNVNEQWLAFSKQNRQDIIGQHFTQMCGELSRPALEELLRDVHGNLQITVQIGDNKCFIEAWSVNSPDNGVIGALVRLDPQ